MFHARIFAAVAALFLGLFVSSGPASAQSLEWRFKSEHRNVVSVELYSQDRDHVWPGDNEV